MAQECTRAGIDVYKRQPLPKLMWGLPWIAVHRLPRKQGIWWIWKHCERIAVICTGCGYYRRQTAKLWNEPFQKRPEDASPTPQLLDTLQKLAADPLNHVVINSGRDHFTLDVYKRQDDCIGGRRIPPENTEWNCIDYPVGSIYIGLCHCVYHP